MMTNFISRLNQLFPLQKLLKLILVIAVGVQVIVITYNHLSGFYHLSGMSHFFIRLLRGVSLSIIAGFMIAIPDLFAIKLLNHSLPWTKRVFLPYHTSVCYYYDFCISGVSSDNIICKPD